MNQKLLFTVLLMLSIAIAFSSCEKGNGVLTTQTLEIDAFDKVDLRRHADIFITQGPTQTVTIEAEENLMDLITTEVVGGEWKIDFQKTVKEYLRMTITITVPNISSIKLIDGSGGDVYLQNVIVANKLHVEMSGDGTINGEVNISDSLKTTLEGSGNITLAGTAANHMVNSSGAGGIATHGLVANTGTATVSGAGDVQVNYTGVWNATISGSGNIRYKGTAPATVDTTGTGAVILVP